MAIQLSIATAMPIGFITIAMETFGERVKARREELGLDQIELARLSGIKQPTVSNIETGRNKGSAYVAQLAGVLKCSANWLATGRGSKSPDPEEFIDPPDTDHGGVPVVGTAQLGDDGYWLETEYPVGQGEGFIRYPTRDPNTYALRVKGDSMRPRIKPGEFVVIEPNHSFGPGEEVMVKTKDGRSMVKVFGHRRGGSVELLSVNEDHRPITLEESQIEAMHYVGGIVKQSMYFEKM